MQKVHRPEIQGLRAVAALLVATFHIWSGRVSGGVDVFFVVSGFLITITLFGHLERHGAIRPLTYLARLARRLLPAALTVLVATLVVSWLWLPSTLWDPTARQVRASAFYYENWALAAASVDYLGQFAEKTPVQHFWALSVQGQFYVIWLVLMLAVWLLTRRTPRRREAVALTLFGGLAVTSFAWSVVETGLRQPFAYFDTTARVWEFALGGMAALLLPKLRLPGAARWVGSWVGLVGLLTCGLVLEVSTVFPGYAAAWPVACALLILAAGSDQRWSAGALLGSRPLTWLGDISYGIYLWHWPLLVLVGHRMGGRPGLLVGLAVIAAAVLLAWATNRWIERPVQSVAPGRRWVAAAVAAATAVVLVAGGSVGSAALADRERALAADARKVEKSPPKDPCWGGAALPAGPARCPLSINEGKIWPDPSTADLQKPLPCLDHRAVGRLAVCRMTKKDGTDRPRMLLVGDSHALNARAILDPVRRELGWDATAIAEPGCRPSTVQRTSPQAGKEEECRAWERELERWVHQEGPFDVLVSISSTTLAPGRPDGGAAAPVDFDAHVRGHAELWRRLGDDVRKVVVLRDWPHMEVGVVSCVESAVDAGRNPATDCGRPREDALEPDPAVAAARTQPERWHVVDLTDSFCSASTCYPVAGRVWSHLDAVHITQTFGRSLGPFALEQLRAQGFADLQ